MSFVVPEPPEPPEDPLIPELHADNSPPPPATAAPAPAARSKPRRLRPVWAASAALGLAGCALWSVMVQSFSFDAAPVARDRV
jgi:hypothetical protein